MAVVDHYCVSSCLLSVVTNLLTVWCFGLPVLCCTGLGWAALGWAGLGWAGLGYAVLCRFVLGPAEEGSFTRPLVPFDCKGMGGCGAGTRRVPAKSCAIDPAVMSASYEWDWKHHNPTNPHNTHKP